MIKKQSTIAKLPTESENDVGSDVGFDRNEAELLAFIKKGGSSARPATPRPPLREFTLRIREDIAARVEKAASARELKTTNTSWITEAILAKLKKEKF